MNQPLTCPTCGLPLTSSAENTFACDEEHRFSGLSLALSTNITALGALWTAIRALEDDAASLDYMATHYGDDFGMSADARRKEAEAAKTAAETLRRHARRAQDRLNALSAASASDGGPGLGAGPEESSGP